MLWSYNKLIWLQGWICDCGIILKRVESLTWDSCYNFHKTIQMVDVGSSLKSVMWLPLPWTCRRPPLRRVASLIPPGRKFCTANVPPSPDISQPAPTAGWERSAIQLPQIDMSGSAGDAHPEYIRARRFKFPGQLDSSYARDLPNTFLPAIKKQTPTTLSIKSPELSLIFNARYTRKDIPKSSQIVWHIPGT